MAKRKIKYMGIVLLICAGIAAALAHAQTATAPELQRAIDEFRTQSRNLGLRGDSSPAKRTLAAYHGRIFHNLRNDIFDAVPHEIRQRGGEKSLLRRNQFGFNVAGPLVIPKIYNGGKKTFISISFEGVRERISRSYLRTVPISGERSGDYSQVVDQSGQPLQIYDPLSTRLNPAFDASLPVSRANLQYIRDPFPSNRIPEWRLNPAAMGAVQLYPEPNSAAGPFFRNNYFVVSPESNTANGMILKLEHALSERHRIEGRGAFSNGLAGYANYMPSVADSSSADRIFSSRRGSVQHTFTASPRDVYTFDFEASSDVSRTSAEVFPSYSFSGNYLPMGRSNPLTKNAQNRYEFGSAVAAKRGAHSLRMGGQFTRYEANVYSPQYPAGRFRFGPGLTSLPGITNTGHAFASFLLGGAEGVERSVVGAPSYFRRSRLTLYARDRYEFRRDLSFTAGLNLELNTPRKELYNRQTTIDLKLINPANGRPGALAAAGRDGYGEAFQPVRARLEPSLGLAWNPGGDSDTVVRISYSRGYQPIPFGSGQWGTQGFNAYPSWVSPNAQLTPAFTLNGDPPAVMTALPDLRPDAVNGTIADLVDMTERQPVTDSFSAIFERQMPGEFTVTMGANHSGGENLLIGNSAANPNAIPLDALAYRDQLNDESFRRTLRPYSQYQGFDVNGLYPIGRYQRTEGYLRLEKRTSGGLGLSAQYEFSKQLDDYSGPYGVQDFYNRDNEWSLTSYNNPHRLSVSYVYDVPIGAGHGLFAFSDWRRYLVSGWSLSGMTSISSGAPLALTPQFNNTGGVIQTLNVNSVPGVDPAVAEPGPDLWFNPAAFDQPDDFTPGNASRTHPYLLAPGSQNHDLSLTKRIAVDGDRALELSAVGFNFLNHANWDDPDVVIGPADAPNVNAGRIIGSRGGRIIQLGLRYSF